jgi:RNA polymerase-binding transcription factor
MLDEATLGRLRAALEEERADLRKQIEDLGADPDSDDVAFGSDAGFADRSHSTEERSRTISVVQALRTNLRDCDRALAKMVAGTYGACESCGKDIPLERLEALPSATLCITCKQRGLGR